MAAARRSACLITAALFLFGLAGQAQAAIYWGNGPPIGRANLDGTQAQFDFIPIVPSQGGNFIGCGGVAVDARHVFWADPPRGAIGRANLDGTAPDYTFITGAENPCGVAVDATHVYWANFTANSIGRAKLDGTEATQVFVGAVSEPCGVAVDDRFLYWASAGFHYVGRALLLGGVKGPHLIDGNGDFDFCGVAVNRTHVFWGGFGEAIGRANLDGSEPDPSFITGAPRPCGLAVDAAGIYWSEQELQAAAIGAARLDGTAVKRGILTGLRGLPCGIAVDGVTLAAPGPPPPSRFSFGKVKRNRRRWVTFIAVEVPDTGFFRVKATRGVRWLVLPDRTTGSSLSGGGRRWLRLWPARGGAGHRLRRRIKRRGRARIAIEIRYMQLGHALTVKRKRLSLVRSRRRRPGRRAALHRFGPLDRMAADRATIGVQRLGLTLPP